jgi:outer membrane protein TolC
MAYRDRDALDREAAIAIDGGLSTLDNFAGVARLYRTTLIPQAEQSFRASLESYQVGSIDFPMLMDSVMSELQFRREYVGMLGEMHMTKARLEAAVGKELDGNKGTGDAR